MSIADRVAAYLYLLSRILPNDLEVVQKQYEREPSGPRREKIRIQTRSWTPSAQIFMIRFLGNDETYSRDDLQKAAAGISASRNHYFHVPGVESQGFSTCGRKMRVFKGDLKEGEPDALDDLFEVLYDLKTQIEHIKEYLRKKCLVVTESLKYNEQ
ncbi:hypothetical protein MMC21_006442 [Puttea exsequens]|nr:hypothetical protein [Puttea exsequens]